jgi:hypothetical protein
MSKHVNDGDKGAKNAEQAPSQQVKQKEAEPKQADKQENKQGLKRGDVTK